MAQTAGSPECTRTLIVTPEALADPTVLVTWAPEARQALSG
jgi:hypothetical protein